MRNVQKKQLQQYCVGPSTRQVPLHMLLIRSDVLFLKQSFPDGDWGPSTMVSEQDKALPWTDLAGGRPSGITPPRKACPALGEKHAGWKSPLIPSPPCASHEVRQPGFQQSFDRVTLFSIFL